MAEQVAPRMLRIHDGEIEMIAGDADLRVHVVAEGAQRTRHLHLEVRLRLARGEPAGREVLLLREAQVVAQHTQSARTLLGDAQVRRVERAVDVEPELGAREQHVEPALAAARVDRAEVLRDDAALVGPVA